METDITVLTPDLSHNCLGRAHLLAKLLERNYEVEILGPLFGSEIWSPVKEDFDYKTIDASRKVLSIPSIAKKIVNQASGDVIYASKPLMSSFGCSLLSQILSQRPLILDIDDWESGLKNKSSKFNTYLFQFPRIIKMNSFYWTRALEIFSSSANRITVSNTFLQNRFNGTIIPHARDTDKLAPEKYNKEIARDELDLPHTKTLVMFFGTPRPHKGVEDLIEAVKICSNDIFCVIVGGKDDSYLRKLRQQANDQVLFFGQQPFETVPQWLAAADIAAIPQRDTLSAVGQIPAKIFDAMAMGVPIISTEVSDIPHIISDSGRTVPPSNPEALAKEINTLARDEKKRHQLGTAARERCVEEYSYDAIAPELASIVDSVLTET